MSLCPRPSHKWQVCGWRAFHPEEMPSVWGGRGGVRGFISTFARASWDAGLRLMRTRQAAVAARSAQARESAMMGITSRLGHGIAHKSVDCVLTFCRSETPQRFHLSSGVSLLWCEMRFSIRTQLLVQELTGCTLNIGSPNVQMNLFAKNR